MKYSHFYPWQILTNTFRITISHNFGKLYCAERLQQECQHIFEQFPPGDQHGQDHDGGWKAISLVSPGGDPYQDRTADGGFSKTPVLEYAPYLEQIIDELELDYRRIRLMQLLPGENIYWHFDPDESIDEKNVRLHIPIFTNPQIRFQISHEDCKWLPGELWYGDFTFPHRLRNDGTEPRVHLVIDLVTSDKFLSRLPQNVRDGKRQRQIIRKACQRACRVYTARRYGYLNIGPYKFVLSNK